MKMIKHRNKRYIYIPNTGMWREHRKIGKSAEITLLPQDINDKFAKWIVFTNINQVWNGKKLIPIKKTHYLIDGLVRTAQFKKNPDRQIMQQIKKYTGDTKILQFIFAMIKNKYYRQKKIFIFDHNTRSLLNIILKIFEGDFSFGGTKKYINSLFIYYYITDVSQMDDILSSKKRIVHVVYNDDDIGVTQNNEFIAKINNASGRNIVLYNQNNILDDMSSYDLYDVRNIMYSIMVDSNNSTKI